MLASREAPSPIGRVVGTGAGEVRVPPRLLGGQVARLPAPAAVAPSVSPGVCASRRQV